VGTAICGNSAIAAAGPAIGAKDDEVCYAVGCITLFGLFALIAYPFRVASGCLRGDPHLAGLFLGAAIHDNRTGRRRGHARRAAHRRSQPCSRSPRSRSSCAMRS
jgi:uncharacterized membrane protein YadS